MAQNDKTGAWQKIVLGGILGCRTGEKDDGKSTRSRLYLITGPLFEIPLEKKGERGIL